MSQPSNIFPIAQGYNLRDMDDQGSYIIHRKVFKRAWGVEIGEKFYILGLGKVYRVRGLIG